MRQEVVHSHEHVELLMNEVLDEMRAHGLLTKGVWRTPVVTVMTDVHIGLAHGLYVVRPSWTDGLLGFQPGTVYVPRFSFGGVVARLGRRRCMMRDVIRHEFAHALAFTGGDLVRGSARLRRVFGGDHDDDEPIDAPRRAFVSGYATTNPCEDFAESVMIYLRHRGALDRYRSRPELLRKMRFIAGLRAEIGRMGIRSRV